MKKVFLLILIVFLLVPFQVYANGAGLPPYFEINGKLTTSNPLQLYGITSQSFLIPQDFSPENYVVNQPIDFFIDQTQLFQVIPNQEVLNHIKYTWDFGDGTKADGLHNRHVYTHIGSYILIVTINLYTAAEQQPTQFVDSFLLHIIPNKDWNNLPQSVMAVNGQTITDSLDSRIETDFSQTVKFSAATSHVAGSKIVQYLWNFGDGQTSTQPIVSHRYSNSLSISTVVLRVKDSNGFISDTFAGLVNTSSLPNSTKLPPQVSRKPQDLGVYPYITIGIFLLCLVLSAYFYIKKRIYNSKKLPKL